MRPSRRLTVICVQVASGGARVRHVPRIHAMQVLTLRVCVRSAAEGEARIVPEECNGITAPFPLATIQVPQVRRYGRRHHRECLLVVLRGSRSRCAQPLPPWRVASVDVVVGAIVAVFGVLARLLATCQAASAREAREAKIRTFGPLRAQ